MALGRFAFGSLIAGAGFGRACDPGLVLWLTGAVLESLIRTV